MRIIDISLDDGRTLAHLINFLKVGRWDLSGEEADKLMTVRKLVHELANQAASQLRTDSKATPVADQSMKIKAMGPIGSPAIKKSNSKKK